MRPIYTDEGTEYPEINQPPGWAVSDAEEHFEDQEVTWPEVAEYAWRLVEEAEGR